jgi:hypothetical protein
MMTPDQFIFLQDQLWNAFGPLIPWLIVGLVAGGIYTGLMIFALMLLRGID